MRMVRIFAACVLCLILRSNLNATMIVPISVEELTRRASDVVEATVLNSWSAWNPQHTLIYTYTQMQVIQSLKGTSQSITVKQIGGKVGNVTQKVAGVRQFQIGEQAMLFLRPSQAGDGTHVIVGLMQGNFRIARSTTGEMIASNGVSGVHSLQQGKVEHYAGASMRLADLESVVRGALTQ
ncbi:MAG TPA: hypothetical protein VEG30_06590 [Terriglobales bacterium]|nr:hypothetical protein [Terriglobales bacterium]